MVPDRVNRTYTNRNFCCFTSNKGKLGTLWSKTKQSSMGGSKAPPGTRAGWYMEWVSWDAEHLSVSLYTYRTPLKVPNHNSPNERSGGTIYFRAIPKSNQMQYVHLQHLTINFASVADLFNFCHNVPRLWVSKAFLLLNSLAIDKLVCREKVSVF